MARKTVYCVQAYAGAAAGYVKSPLRQFGTSGEALDEGSSLSERRPGVLVFSVSGEPDFDLWEEPRVLAIHGNVPAVGF